MCLGISARRNEENLLRSGLDLCASANPAEGRVAQVPLLFRFHLLATDLDLLDGDGGAIEPLGTEVEKILLVGSSQGNRLDQIVQREGGSM